MLVSNIGRSAYFVSMTWVLLSWTGNVRLVSLMLLSSTVAQLFSSGITGFFADVIDRKRMSIVLDFTRALIVTLTGFSIMAGMGVLALYISIATFSIADRGHIVAMQSLIPVLTGNQNAVSAHAASCLMMQLGTFAGALIFTFLVDAQAYGPTMSLLGSIFCLSAFSVYAMGVPKRAQSLEGGLERWWRHSISIKPLSDCELIVPAICYSLILGVGIFINTLLSAYVLNSMGGDMMLFGKLEAAWALGAVLVCVAFWGRIKITSTLPSLPVCLLMSGLWLVLLYIFPFRSVVPIVLAALGGTYNLGRILIDVRVQRAVDIGSIGRAKGALNIIATVLGMAIYGLIALSSEWLSPSHILACWGIFIAVIGGFLEITTKFQRAERSGQK